MGTKHINWDMTHNDITPRTLGNKNTTFFGWNCQQRENTHRISSLQDASCKVFSTSWKKIAKKCKKWCVGLFSEQKWDEMGQWMTMARIFIWHLSRRGERDGGREFNHKQGHVLVFNLLSFVPSTPFHTVFYMILCQPGAINPRSAFPFRHPTPPQT